MKFKVNDKVKKPKGYAFDGVLWLSLQPLRAKLES